MILESPAELSAHPAIVTVLPEPGSANPDEPMPPPIRFEAVIERLDSPVMEIQSKIEVPARSALKIETSDALWLGEVETCGAQGAGWTIRVRLRHVLRDFDTLTRLAERFGTAAPRALPVRV